MRKLSLALLLFVSPIVAWMGAPSLAMAETGTVDINISKPVFIDGVAAENGSLRCAGYFYTRSLGGVSQGPTIGQPKIGSNGFAQRLYDLSDTEGVRSGAGLAIASSGRTANLANTKRVVLTVRGRKVGFMFSVERECRCH